MSIFRNDTLGSWTRGGQAIVHNVRMTTQVFFQTVIAGLVLWVMGTIWWALEYTTDYQRYVLMKLVEASFKADAAPGTNDPVQFKTPAGQAYWTSADWLMPPNRMAQMSRGLSGRFGPTFCPAFQGRRSCTAGSRSECPIVPLLIADMASFKIRLLRNLRAML